MFSWPPAMTISLSPQATDCAASITAFSPEPQTALIVSAGISCGRPASISAWRAGFWPAAGCQHLAEDHLAHACRIDAAALEHRP